MKLTPEQQGMIDIGADHVFIQSDVRVPVYRCATEGCKEVWFPGATDLIDVKRIDPILTPADSARVARGEPRQDRVTIYLEALRYRKPHDWFAETPLCGGQSFYYCPKHAVRRSEGTPGFNLGKALRGGRGEKP